MRRAGIAAVILATALAAIGAWPLFVAQRADDASAEGEPTPAPVIRDDLTRDAQVAFWEHAAGQHLRGDVLTPVNLSGQYMQRYRERGDIGEILGALLRTPLAAILILIFRTVG
jgi:hypothetical protein